MNRRTDTWRNGCFRKMDDHPVHATPNLHPSKMDVLQKTFLQIILAAKLLVRHSITFPNSSEDFYLIFCLILLHQPPPPPHYQSITSSMISSPSAYKIEERLSLLVEGGTWLPHLPFSSQDDLKKSFWENNHFGRVVVWCGFNRRIIHYFKAFIVVILFY